MHPAVARGIGTAAVGAAIGGLPKTKYDPETGKDKKRTNKQRLTGAAIGGAVGGLYGTLRGIHAHRSRVPGWLRKAKTRAEAKSLYKAEARKHHPDLGGDPAKFRKLVKEWEMNEPNYKSAMLHAFADEIEKIANAGTVAGAGLGYYLAPNSVKGKIIGTAAGAIGGGILGGLAGAAKRTFYDEPRAYERAQLYGYMPATNPAYGSPAFSY